MALRNHAIDSFELPKPDSDFANTQAPLTRHSESLVDFRGPGTNSQPCGQKVESRGRWQLLSAVEARNCGGRRRRRSPRKRLCCVRPQRDLKTATPRIASSMVEHMHQVKEGNFMVGAAARYVTVHERSVCWKSNRKRFRLFGARNWIGPGGSLHSSSIDQSASRADVNGVYRAKPHS